MFGIAPETSKFSWHFVKKVICGKQLVTLFVLLTLDTGFKVQSNKFLYNTSRSPMDNLHVRLNVDLGK